MTEENDDAPVKFAFEPMKLQEQIKVEQVSPTIVKHETPTPFVTPEISRIPTFAPNAPIKKRGKSKIARAIDHAQARTAYEREREGYAAENKWLAYMDESCHNNGRPNAYSGYGVFFGDGDVKNIAEKVPKQPNQPQTNNSAALYALLYLFRITPETQGVVIRPDSMYAFNVVTQWMQKWQRNGWTKGDGMPPSNLDIVKQLYDMWTPTRENHTHFVWVAGHSHTYGNDKADELANEGAAKHVMSSDGGVEQKARKLDQHHIGQPPPSITKYRLPPLASSSSSTSSSSSSTSSSPPVSSKSTECKVVQVKIHEGKLMEPYDVYVGRECHRGGLNLTESKWANPYTTSMAGGSVDEACRLYRQYIVRCPFFLEGLQELRAKVLGCLCPAETPCHARVLASFANQVEHVAGLQIMEGDILIKPMNVIIHIPNSHDEEHKDGFSYALSKHYHTFVPKGDSGTVQLAPLSTNQYVAWCFAKNENNEEVRIKAFRESLKKLTQWILERPEMKTILIPFGIGCGKYGRGNWTKYAQCLQEFQKQLPMSAELVLIRKEEE